MKKELKNRLQTKEKIKTYYFSISRNEETAFADCIAEFIEEQDKEGWVCQSQYFRTSKVYVIKFTKGLLC